MIPAKYNCGDTVVIVPKNKDGVIIGVQHSFDSTHGLQISYDVSYECDLRDPLGVGQVVKGRKVEWFPEEDIRPLDHQDLQKIISEVWESQFVNTAFGRDLERLADSVGANRTPCAHEWQSYEGLTQKYDYCSKCDIKRQ